MTNTVQTPNFSNIGNGVTTTWPFTFLMVPEASMVLYIVDNSLLTWTLLDPSLYTVTLNLDRTGSVTYPLSGTPLSSSFSIVGVRETARTQGISFANQTRYYASVIEALTDKIVASLQEVGWKADRALIIREATQVPLEKPSYTRSLVLKTDGTFALGATDPVTATVAELVIEAEAAFTATSADRVQTGLDAETTGTNAISTAADRLQTGLDRVATADDVGLTHADVVTTGASATAAATSAANAQASAFTLAAWSALSAITGTAAGQGAEVLDADTGTHTDPVVGGTVTNAGRFTWSASPAGWKWISATGLSGANTKITAEVASRIGLIDGAATVDQWAELTLDASNLPVCGIKQDGTEWEARSGSLTQMAQRAIEELGPISYTRSVPTIDNWAELTLDAAGKFVAGKKQDGTTWAVSGGTLVQTSGASLPVARTYSYKVTTGTYYYAPAIYDVMIPVIGQSLAVGTTADASGVVTSTAEHAGFALMPSTGVKQTGAAFTAYADLVENAVGSLKETVCSGMADAIMRKLNTDLGFKPRMIFAAVGYGGQAYYGSQTISDGGLKRGSTYYQNLLTTIKSARDTSLAAGKTLIIPAIVVVHGEEDYKLPTSRQNYMRALTQWRQTLQEDILTITGQKDMLRFYVSQTQRAQTTAIGVDLRTPQAMLDAMDKDPAIIVTGPIYYGLDGGDASHPSVRSYRRMGEHIGNVIASDLFGAYWLPVRVTRAYWTSSTVIRLEFDRTMAIESDDSKITISTLGAGKGIDFTDGSGSPPTVTGIALALSNTAIDVTLSAAPTGLRPQVFIAARTNGTSNEIGSITGARSGIREATAFDTDPSDSAIMYHWACHQQIAL